MYISVDGSRLYRELDKLIDTIKLNINLDINDIPFDNIGIVRNFSKNNYSDTINYIKLQINDMLKANGYADKVSIKSVEFNSDSNQFIINLSALENNFDLIIDGGE